MSFNYDMAKPMVDFIDPVSGKRVLLKCAITATMENHLKSNPGSDYEMINNRVKAYLQSNPDAGYDNIVLVFKSAAKLSGDVVINELEQPYVGTLFPAETMRFQNDARESVDTGKRKAPTQLAASVQGLAPDSGLVAAFNLIVKTQLDNVMEHPDKVTKRKPGDKADYLSDVIYSPLVFILCR